MIKFIFEKTGKLLLIILILFMLASCGNKKKSIEDNATYKSEISSEKEIIINESEAKTSASESKKESETQVSDSEDIELTDNIKNGNSPFTEEYVSETESKWLEDKLYVLAANEIGEDRLENCAADATNAKFLITESDEMNAWLMQYAILLQMQEQGYTNINVMFVFYKTMGDVGTKYLQTTFQKETLDNLDLQEFDSYLELEKYTE